MKIYLAARFTAQQEMRGVRDVLTVLGYEVTSSWIDLTVHEVGPVGLTPDVMNADPDRCAPHAAHDMDDLLRADAVALFTSLGASTTGGRHVELGMALAAGKRVMLVGPRENIFQTLPQVEHYSDWPRLVMALTPARFTPASVAS